MGSNFGATLLDVQSGMEYAKQNQRRDAEWERNQKRADTADKVSQYGLEDVERKRGDAQAMRDAVKGKSSVSEAAKAAKQASLASGDLDGARQASTAELDDDLLSLQKSATALRQMQTQLQTKQTQGQVARQPGLEEVADQQLFAARQDAAEDVAYRSAKILATGGKKAYMDVINKLGGVNGVQVADVHRGNDEVVLIAPDGNELATMSIPYLRSIIEKRMPKPETKVLKEGEQIVQISNDGKGTVTPKFSAPAKAPVDKFMPITEGTTGFYDPRTGKTIPVGSGQPSGAKRDTRVKVADSIVKEALGGSLNMGLPGEDAQRDYPIIMQKVGELIDKGVPPEKAAYDAMQEVKRAAEIAKGKKEAGLDTVQPQNWQQLSGQPSPFGIPQ